MAGSARAPILTPSYAGGSGGLRPGPSYPGGATATEAGGGTKGNGQAVK